MQITVVYDPSVAAGNFTNYATDGFRSGKVEFVASGDIPAMRLCEVMGAKVIAPTGFKRSAQAR